MNKINLNIEELLNYLIKLFNLNLFIFLYRFNKLIRIDFIKFISSKV
jgi:hypothetical protein